MMQQFSETNGPNWMGDTKGGSGETWRHRKPQNKQCGSVSCIAETFCSSRAVATNLNGLGTCPLRRRLDAKLTGVEIFCSAAF
jgi:hypothetical protein